MPKQHAIYLWEPEASPHKLPLFSELLSHRRVRGVTYIAQRQLNERRRLQGWEAVIRNDDPIIFAPPNEQVDSIVANSPHDSVHIFSGMHWVPCIVEGLRAVIRHGRRFGILSEPRVFEGISGVARLGHSWITEGHLRANANFVLAIGAHGPKWFRMAGYDPAKIFPFAYFLPEPRADRDAPFSMTNDWRPNVCFLGRLERLKGIHLYLEAINLVQNPARYYVAGHGSAINIVRNAVREEPPVTYLGPIRMPDVGAFLARTDVLVLPSITKDDGWGAVVSEALMAGSAVVASSKVGASMCLKDPIRGSVVHQLHGKAVATAIDSILSSGYCTPHFREIRSGWARDHLSQQRGADYLLQILDHVFEGQPHPTSFVS